MEYVQHLHAQKEMFSEFLKTIVEPVKEKPRILPTAVDIKAAVLCFQGPLVTYQAFKKPPTEILNWLVDVLCSKDEYAQRFSEPINQLITANVQTALVNTRHDLYRFKNGPAFCNCAIVRYFLVFTASVVTSQLAGFQS